MDSTTRLEQILDNQSQALTMLEKMGVQDPLRSHTNLVNIAQLGVPLDLVSSLIEQLHQHLLDVSDPDMALNNLERFITSARSPLSLVSLFDRDRTAIPILLKIFSTSQYLTDRLIRDAESYDSLRLTEGQPIHRSVLIDELSSELESLPIDDESLAMSTIRRFKHRETLRIAYGDIVGRQDLQTVMNQISYLADAICQGALEFCQRKLSAKYGLPGTVVSNEAESRQAGVVFLALGKLGGSELNYSSDIDLILLYESEGETSGNRTISNREYFDRLGRLFVRLLTENTPLGSAYRVDLRLRPGGSKAAIACSVESALSYYDLRGRTWERQALVKARPIAGDMEMGRCFLQQLQPWIFAKRMRFSDIQGIKVLKRQIERRTLNDGEDNRNLKTGRGGIRDIEFVIQFLQLLHGAELETLRSGNTLEAISRLFEAGCISSQEQILLDQGYRWLRKLEHRLQIMFDLQTHALPDDDNEIIKIARRMDYVATRGKSIIQQFSQELSRITGHHRQILDHLLHDAFVPDQGEQVQPETDLVLDPQPSDEFINTVLAPFNFADCDAAYRHLMDLATEKNGFLSPRRCRHFLAAIASSLLKEISTTPDPDATLRQLNRVSESLGGKALLWELFSSHKPSMNLFIRLCATSQYLCDILTSHPGMIDGLMDSLIMQALPQRDFLENLLADLLSGAEDIDLIIHSFKYGQHLRVGVRDVLGQDRIRDTHRTLSDIAEVCVTEVARREFKDLTRRFGEPSCSANESSHLVILAMGKLGGQDPNYHSDLDVIFTYNGDGSQMTIGGRDSTSNQDFYSRLAAKITNRISVAGPYGRLYEIDSRLRPTGKSGSLAVSINEFTRYFAQGTGQLWERMALCKARPVFCSDFTQQDQVFDRVESLIKQLISMHPWKPEFAGEIYETRIKMQQGASTHNIKRGTGGTVDVEFAVEMLQLKFASAYPDVLVPGTLEAAAALHDRKLLSTDDFEFLTKSYQMLRWVEARIRLMNTTGRHDLPADEQQLAALAFLLRYDNQQQLLDEIVYLRQENRRRLEALVELHS